MWSHITSYALDKNGQFYSFGGNQFGQLGISNDNE